MDAMIDLETWGTRPGASLRSVGLVTFALGRPAEGGERFYANICRDSCRERGLREEQGTVDWWARQSQEARDALEVDPLPLAEAVDRVIGFFGKYSCKCVWAQGANFDPGLWETACRVVGREAPWRFYNVRDTRTVYDLAGLDPRTIPRPGGVAHNALGDALHQVACVQAAWAMLCNPVQVQARAERLVRGGYSAPPGDKPAAPTSGSGVLVRTTR